MCDWNMTLLMTLVLNRLCWKQSWKSVCSFAHWLPMLFAVADILPPLQTIANGLIVCSTSKYLVCENFWYTACQLATVTTALVAFFLLHMISTLIIYLLTWSRFSLLYVLMKVESEMSLYVTVPKTFFNQGQIFQSLSQQIYNVAKNLQCSGTSKSVSKCFEVPLGTIPESILDMSAKKLVFDKLNQNLNVYLFRMWHMRIHVFTIKKILIFRGN